MVEITDTPPLSIRRGLDVMVLQEVRASSRPYIGLHVPRELQDNPRTPFFHPENPTSSVQSLAESRSLSR